jgi:sugar phosphate isomerase/epimerase
MERRDFIAATAPVALLPAAGCVTIGTQKPRFTVGLSQYSLRALIKDKSLNALDYPKFTMDTFGITAIDLWEGGLPKESLDDPIYLGKMRKNAAAAGTDLFLLMTGVLDANPDRRDASLAQLTPSILRAKILGADFLRIFLRAPGEDAAAAVAPCVEALKPLADAAGQQGIMIAIEPGASKLSQRGAFLVDVIKALKHPWCKLMPDFGKQVNNVYDGTEVMMPYTVTVSAKMHSFDASGKQPDFDYERLVKIIAASSYSGYIAIEWEGHKLKPITGVKASQKLLQDAFIANGV